MAHHLQVYTVICFCSPPTIQNKSLSAQKQDAADVALNLLESIMVQVDIIIFIAAPVDPAKKIKSLSISAWLA